MSRRTLAKLRKMLKDERQRLLITLELLADGRFQELGLDHPCKVVAALAALHDQLVRLVESQYGDKVGDVQEQSVDGKESEKSSKVNGLSMVDSERENVHDTNTSIPIPPIETYEDAGRLLNTIFGERRVSRLPEAILYRFKPYGLRDLYLAGLISKEDYGIALLLYHLTKDK